MLLCKGRGCKYRKVCSRYVLGTAMPRYVGCDDTWIDHCLNAAKFMRVGTASDGQCPPQKKDDAGGRQGSIAG